jgi:hypothetical protein
MVKSDTENDMKAEFIMTSNGGSSLYVVRNLLDNLLLIAAAAASGDDNTREVQSATFRVKIQGLALICCV